MRGPDCDKSRECEGKADDEISLVGVKSCDDDLCWVGSAMGNAWGYRETFNSMAGQPFWTLLFSGTLNLLIEIGELESELESRWNCKWNLSLDPV